MDLTYSLIADLLRGAPEWLVLFVSAAIPATLLITFGPGLPVRPLLIVGLVIGLAATVTGVVLLFRRTPTRLLPGARHTFALEEVGPSNEHLSPDGWSFRTNIDVDEPESRLLCFVTPGAPATSGCNTIDRATVEPGP